MHDEKGYVQFHCDWDRADPPAADALRAWRDRLRRLGLVGVYPDGIGYGNLSVRRGGTFIITGTATGALETLGPEHVTEVTAFDIGRNWLRCRGPAQASSESLSHAAIYRTDPTVRAVIHVHHAGLWNGRYDKLPTTDPHAQAGTPAMASAIEWLFRDGAVRDTGLFVMGGHRDGIMAFGGDLEDAGLKLLAALNHVDAV